MGFVPLKLLESGGFCGTRLWSASGGRGKLSHHALDDCYERGAKPGAGGRVRTSSAVPHLLVSTVHIRAPARVLPRRRPGLDPKFFPASAGTPSSGGCPPAQREVPVLL